MIFDGHRRTALRTTRALGAIALLVLGGLHFEQYVVAHFSVIPTIGSLFLLNFIAASALGLVLLIPIRGSARRGRLLSTRWRRWPTSASRPAPWRRC